MAELTTELAGLELRSPLILASGPLSHDGEAVARAYDAGAGAVVTKTIRPEAARNPIPHIARLGNALLNGERWSELPARAWIDREIPLAKDSGATVIASLGLDARDVTKLARPIARAGADALEVCSYDADEIVPMVTAAVRDASIPVLAKVSANWPDVVEVARACVRAGAAGITAIDSVGPALRLNVERREPLLGSGVGWLSGAAVLAIAVRVVADVARATDVAIVGTGGVRTADDCVEMLMAGARAIGLCSFPMLAGLGSFVGLSDALSIRLDELGFARIGDAIGAALPALSRCERESNGLHASRENEAASVAFDWREAWCSSCGVCAHVCPYRARTAPNRHDGARCRGCGLCASACPTGALSLGRTMANGL